ncbi:hypothetical protein Lbir_2687 [Legionella birminghamensis]|uniref:Uncharacterized protein n=1 Tax=Legionella birminghamensis TaxID=28083 RepID=A0A378I8U3_9GAMM|nr:hypothetical protein [Legionella birminghamensis]KTC68085.1 hypothetical protein Lbir_2687 [Legionella birminghamensis]STX31205.1 Uncharacterised protein [Legionella birminghamensis]
MKNILDAIYNDDLQTLNTLSPNLPGLTDVHSHQDFAGTLLMHAVRAKNIHALQLLLNLRDSDNQMLIPINKIVNDKTALDLILDEEPSVVGNHIKKLLRDHKAQSFVELSQNTHDTVVNRTALAAVNFLQEKYEVISSDWEQDFNNYKKHFSSLECQTIKIAFKRIHQIDTQFSHLGNRTLLMVMNLVWTAINDKNSLTTEQKELLEKTAIDKQDAVLDEIVINRKLLLFRNLYVLQNEYGFQLESCPHGLANGIISSLNGVYPKVLVLDKTDLDQLIINDINSCIRAVLNEYSFQKLLTLYKAKYEDEALEDFYLQVKERFRALVKEQYFLSILDEMTVYNPFKDEFDVVIQQFSFPNEEFKMLEYLSLLLTNTKQKIDFLYQSEEEQFDTHLEKSLQQTAKLMRDNFQDSPLLANLSDEEIEQVFLAEMRRQSYLIDYNGKVNPISLFIGIAKYLGDSRFSQYLPTVISCLEFIGPMELLTCFKSIQLPSICEQIYNALKDKLTLNLSHKIKILPYIKSTELRNSIINELIESDIDTIQKLQEFYLTDLDDLSDETIKLLQSRFIKQFTQLNFLELLEKLPPKNRIRICINTEEKFIYDFLENEILFSALLEKIPPNDWGRFFDLYHPFLIGILKQYRLFTLAHIINVITPENWDELLKQFKEKFNYQITDNTIHFLTTLTLLRPERRLHLCRIIPAAEFQELLHSPINLAVFFSLFNDDQFLDTLSTLDLTILREDLSKNEALFIVLTNLSFEKQKILINHIGLVELKSFISSIEKLILLHQRIDIFSNNLFSFDEICTLIKSVDDYKKVFAIIPQPSKESFFNHNDSLKVLGADETDYYLVQSQFTQIGLIKPKSFIQYIKLINSVNIEQRYALYQQLGGKGMLLNLVQSLVEVGTFFAALHGHGSERVYREIGGFEYITSLPYEFCGIFLVLIELSSAEQNKLIRMIGGINSLESLANALEPEEAQRRFPQLLSLLDESLLLQLFEEKDLDNVSNFYELLALPRVVFNAYIKHLINTRKIEHSFDFNAPLDLEKLSNYIEQFHPDSEYFLQNRGYQNITISDLEEVELLKRTKPAVINILRHTLNPFYLLMEQTQASSRKDLLLNFGQDFVSRHHQSVTHFSQMLMLFPENERKDIIQFLNYTTLVALFEPNDLFEKIITEMVAIYSCALEYGFNYLLRNGLVAVLGKFPYSSSLIYSEKLISEMVKDARDFSGTPAFGFLFMLLQAIPRDDWSSILANYEVEDLQQYCNEKFFKLAFAYMPYQDQQLIDLIDSLLQHPKLTPLRNAIVKAVLSELVAVKLSTFEYRRKFLSLFSSNELTEILRRNSLFLDPETSPVVAINIQMWGTIKGQDDSMVVFLDWLLTHFNQDELSTLFANSLDLSYLLMAIPKSYQVAFFSHLKSIILSTHRDLLPNLLRLLSGDSLISIVELGGFKDHVATFNELCQLIRTIPSKVHNQFINQLKYTAQEMEAGSLFFLHSIMEGTVEEKKSVFQNIPFARIFNTPFQFNATREVVFLDKAIRPIVFNRILQLVDKNDIPSQQDIHVLAFSLGDDFPSYLPEITRHFDHDIKFELVLYTLFVAHNSITPRKHFWPALAAISPRYLLSQIQLEDYISVLEYESRRFFETIFREDSNLTLAHINLFYRQLKDSRWLRTPDQIPYKNINYKESTTDDLNELFNYQHQEDYLSFFRAVFGNCPADNLPSLLGKPGNAFSFLEEFQSRLADKHIHGYQMILQQELFPRLLPLVAIIQNRLNGDKSDIRLRFIRFLKQQLQVSQNPAESIKLLDFILVHDNNPKETEQTCSKLFVDKLISQMLQADDMTPFVHLLKIIRNNNQSQLIDQYPFIFNRKTVKDPAFFSPPKDTLYLYITNMTMHCDVPLFEQICEKIEQYAQNNRHSLDETQYNQLSLCISEIKNVPYSQIGGPSTPSERDYLSPTM